MAKDEALAVRAPETAPDAVIENSGLCGTCENAARCIYVGDAEHPVLECEEFTHHRADAARRPPRPRSIAAVPQAEAREEESRPALGLCSDCENRAGCMFDKPEGGVWPCEEYC